MEKLENIITLGENFLNALQLLDATSLSEKELLEMDDLKDRMNSHFDFFLASSVHSKEKIKDWFGSNDSKSS
jgi:hypothetical protein